MRTHPNFRAVGPIGPISTPVVWASGKAKATGKGEITLIRAIQGKGALYVAQRAQRQAPFDSPDQVTVPQAEIQQGIEFLRQVEAVTRMAYRKRRSSSHRHHSLPSPFPAA